MNMRKISSLVLSLAVLGVCEEALAAIDVGTPVAKSASNATELTLSVTTNSAAARTLVVPFAWSAIGDLTVLSMTYNGVSLTSAGVNATTIDTTERDFTGIYYLPQAAIGTHDLKITLSGSAVNIYASALNLSSNSATSIDIATNEYTRTYTVKGKITNVDTVTDRDAGSISVDSVINSLTLQSLVPQNNQVVGELFNGAHSAYRAGYFENLLDAVSGDPGTTSKWIANTGVSGLRGAMAQSTAEFVAVPEPGMIFTAMMVSGSALMLRTRKPMAKNRMQRAGSLLRA